jgi:mannonate dehydratase
MSEMVKRQYERERVRAGLRWFGPDDIVTIDNIRQTPGITNVISALHHIPSGAVWTADEIAKRKIEIEFLVSEDLPTDLSYEKQFTWYTENGQPSGLEWDTAESLVFTEDIKNGSPKRTKHIDNYKESLQNLGKYGVCNVVGNFMLVADWTRTGITQLHDGSVALEYIHDAFVAFDLFLLKRHNSIQEYIDDGSYTQEEIDSATSYWARFLEGNSQRCTSLTKMITAGLPGAQAGFTLKDFKDAVAQYEGMSTEVLQEHIAYFLDAVVPVATESGVRLCCHADDPAFSPFMGTPRAVGDINGYKFLLDHGCGVNLCIGSLMPNEVNRDITTVIYELAEYGHNLGMSIDDIFPHIHLRPIETDGKNFREGHHAEHREELAKVVHALVAVEWQGVFRPDHAPASGHGFGRPGYDLVGRGYGAQLLLGLFEMREIMKTTRRGRVEAVIKACGGDLSKLEESIEASRTEERRQVNEKIPEIKLPFTYNTEGALEL